MKACIIDSVKCWTRPYADFFDWVYLGAEPDASKHRELAIAGEEIPDGVVKTSDLKDEFERFHVGIHGIIADLSRGVQTGVSRKLFENIRNILFPNLEPIPGLTSLSALLEEHGQQFWPNLELSIHFAILGNGGKASIEKIVKKVRIGMLSGLSGNDAFDLVNHILQKNAGTAFFHTITGEYALDEPGEPVSALTLAILKKRATDKLLTSTQPNMEKGTQSRCLYEWCERVLPADGSPMHLSEILEQLKTQNLEEHFVISRNTVSTTMHQRPHLFRFDGQSRFGRKKFPGHA